MNLDPKLLMQFFSKASIGELKGLIPSGAEVAFVNRICGSERYISDFITDEKSRVAPGAGLGGNALNVYDLILDAQREAHIKHILSHTLKKHSDKMFVNKTCQCILSFDTKLSSYANTDAFEARLRTGFSAIEPQLILAMPTYKLKSNRYALFSDEHPSYSFERNRILKFLFLPASSRAQPLVMWKDILEQLTLHLLDLNKQVSPNLHLWDIVKSSTLREQFLATASSLSSKPDVNQFLKTLNQFKNENIQSSRTPYRRPYF